MIRRLLVLAVTAGVAALSVGARTESPGIARGEALVQRHCGGCHAVARQDTSPEPAAPPLRDLNRRYAPEMLAEALAEGILTGHPMMPEFQFEPDDVQAIIDHLDSIQTRRPA